MLFKAFSLWVSLLYRIILTCAPLSCFPTVKFIDVCHQIKDVVVLVMEYVDGGEFSQLFFLKLQQMFVSSMPSFT